MKDTLYIGTFLAVVVGLWFYIQKTDFGALPQSSLATTSERSQQRSEKNEKRTQSRNQNDSATAQANGASEGSSGRAEEIEGVPSIYSRKSVEASELKPEGRPSRKARAGSHRSGSKHASNRSSSKSARAKMMHGVPLDQYIEWNQNNLRLGEVAAPDQGGMRLFIQCMEFKKAGPKSVAQAECKGLATRPMALPGAATY